MPEARGLPRSRTVRVSGPETGPLTPIRVRYTIRKGKFTEWHQLPNARPKAREA